MSNLTNAEAFAVLNALQTAELKITAIEETIMLASAYNKLMAICGDTKEEKPKTAKKTKEIDKGKVVALRNAGWVIKDIAGEMQCSTQTIYNILNEAKQT